MFCFFVNTTFELLVINRRLVNPVLFVLDILWMSRFIFELCLIIYLTMKEHLCGTKCTIASDLCSFTCAFWCHVFKLLNFVCWHICSQMYGRVKRRACVLAFQSFLKCTYRRFLLDYFLIVVLILGFLS